MTLRKAGSTVAAGERAVDDELRTAAIRLRIP